MNRFIQELSGICSEHLLQEQWLLAPSLRVGHQWLDNTTLRSVPVLNVRVKTIKGMAIDLAGPEMARRGVSLISNAGSTILVDRILNRMQKDARSYFSSLPPSPTLARTMLRALQALRLARVSPEQIDPSCFEVSEKGLDVAVVLTEFLQAIHQRNLVDYPHVLEMAIDLVANNPEVIPKDTLVLVPEDADLNGLEKDLIEAVPFSKRLTIPVDEAGKGPAPDGETVSDAALLKWILNPAEAPAPSGDGTATLFSAVGECNEVRQVLRHCISAGYSLDRVELLHTDTDTYVPLIYETLVRIWLGPGHDDESLPVTFAEGIPTRYSRSGRALTAWITWSREGYPQAALARMIHEGLLEVPDMEDTIPFSRLATLLRETPIGFGRDRYVPQLTTRISRLVKDLPARSSGPDEDEGSASSTSSSYREDLAGTRSLLDLIEDLLAITPGPDGSDEDLLDAAEQFLTTFARGENELDNYSTQALLDRIREMRRWVSLDSGPISLDIAQWLATLPGEVRVGGSGPRPGCLHVDHALSGGHSGRNHTFIIGLDDGRFPGSGINDPLLLDHERERLSDELPKASAQLGMKLEKFAQLMARLRGTIALGFSCHNLEEDRSMFPSSLVFSAYRILSGQREGEQGDMTAWLPQPASFAPRQPDACMDPSEWWLATLCGKNISNIDQVVNRHFPSLARGLQAAGARETDAFTLYDGFLPNPPEDLNPTSEFGPVMSAGRLETIGRCPLAYYFKYLLKLKLPEELGVDPTQWLDPLQFGNLMHEVFYRFMGELIERDLQPNYDRDHKKLFSILTECVQQYVNDFPPPSESAFRQQLILLIRAAVVFLVEEEVLCRASSPRFLEISLGLPAYEKGTFLDSTDPIRLRLPSGKSIRACGRIDRVDELRTAGESTFSIWDYKSGSMAKYEDRDPLREGRTIQHALYLEIASEVLKKRLSPKARVSHFGYFFPGSRARGLRILRWPQANATAMRIIENLSRTVAQGCFLATNNDEEDCRFCDYQMICDDVTATAAASQRKLENPANVNLDAIRELRNVEG